MSHLMLSRHGIWYYRRVYLTPRKRREIRVSLRTRSKREALLRVEKYLIHNLSTAFRSPSRHTLHRRLLPSNNHNRKSLSRA